MSKKVIRVLIIEDDQEDFLLAKHYLKDIRTHDYLIDWERDYSKALLLIAEQAHDVYLVDYNLGNNTGVDLVKQATNSGIQKPFIFLTGFDKYTVDEKALEAGAVDFLIKNKINKDLLERSIRYAIKQKQVELELLNSNNTKNKLFSIISHDLRGPLTTLVTSLEIIGDSELTLNEEVKNRILTEMNTTTKTTLDLLDNLLSWSRSQIGAISLDLELIQLYGLVDQLFYFLEGARMQKDINLLNEIDIGVEVYADRNFINLVLRNLCTNAIKFTDEGGTVKIKAEKELDNVNISVEDTGTGMDEITIKKILSRNTFYSTYGTHNEKGSGLGLIITSEFIEKHGSKLEVESTLGEGSTFSFSLRSVAE